MMESYNTLYLANSGEIFGGGQVSLIELIKELDQEKFHPIAVCPSEGSLVNELKKMGVDTRIIKMETLRRLNIFSWVRTVRRLTRLIKSEKIDLIHSNGSRATIYGGIAAKLTKVPLVWHVRIADSDGLLDNLLARLVAKIVVISKAVGRRFDWLKNKEEKVGVIYNGIDLDRFNPAINGDKIRAELHLSSGGLLVGTVGRMDWYKAQQYFLQAAKEVTETITDAHFIVVGDGEHRKRLEDLTRQLDLDRNVTFLGNREDVPQILASLDLFVLSSVSEGFGRSAAEAMACGKAVVATKVGGLQEVVDDGISGFLVPPKDPAALSKAIIALLKDKEKSQRMGMAGRKRAEELFDIKKNVKETEELYERIIPRKMP
ncbi:glycosyltransferase family 4 protein [Candidatus Omnitrophota bacterium]